MKTRNVLASFSISLLLMVLFSFLYMPNKTKSEDYTSVPTVFVHGYKGTFHSFGKMLNRFEKDYGWGKKGLIYYVHSDGSLHDMSLGTSKNKPTFIQVIFESNRTSFSESTLYLSKVLHHLKERHHIDAVNLVGHSMGGIVSLKYSTEYLHNAYPSVHKLVTIGSPFAGILKESYFLVHRDRGAKDLKPGSEALRKLHASNFPEGIQVLSIGSTGDTIAAPESVRALSAIVPESQLEEIILENEKLGHGALHEDETVDHLIHRFLWQDSVQ